MTSNQNQELPFHFDSPMAMKQRKRENNLEIVGEEIVTHEIVGDKIVNDGVPKERVKRTNIPRVKITGKRRLYRLLDEDEDDEDIYRHVKF
ncbi:hypothetical protein Tco_0954791 [Tanacetum coccineum]|uniref:Uncharacterized protein n=1 Tax=Tanacetum coccineum TaxID=301880 RepID=A0ABQ5E5D8_9ASTR